MNLAPTTHFFASLCVQIVCISVCVCVSMCVCVCKTVCVCHSDLIRVAAGVRPNGACHHRVKAAAPAPGRQGSPRGERSGSG